jgi:ribonuclease R
MNSENILNFFKKQDGKEISADDILKFFEIPKTNKLEMSELEIILQKLITDDQLVLIKNSKNSKTSKRSKYIFAESIGIFRGKIETTMKGFGFLICENKEIKDIFVSQKNLNGAMNGDVVLVQILKNSKSEKKAEGIVTKIIKRASTIIVGTFMKSEKFGFVVADDKKIKKDIFITNSKNLGAEDGYKVVAEITKWATTEKNPEGKIIEILGKKNDKGVDILSIIKKHNLNDKFDSKVVEEAENIKNFVSDDEIEKRLDLRNEIIVTIDGEDAKDLDDAVSIVKLKNGNYKLGVHIADVSHYVKENSDIDKEAFARATSVYLLNKVVPMLPERLSNGICSLNPKENRLTLSCIMEVDKHGKVVDHKICETVIKTTERMTYTTVSDLLEQKASLEIEQKYTGLLDTFKTMEELSILLTKKREKRGAIDFNFSDHKIILDSNGKPVDIKMQERRIANKIIEEFMILANETVAEHVFWLDIPFVYRIHEIPSEEKIENFNKFIYNLGHHIKGDLKEVHPKALQELLKKTTGTLEEHIIHKLMLRSLRQARYSPINEGHFGLASDYYSHFTSPIRRYPDLIIHRIIKQILNNEITPARRIKLKSIVEKTSTQSSEMERIAEKAERDLDDLKMAEYMADKIGQVFEGTISSILAFGMFIELENTVEGLVKVENMDGDYYIYDEERLRFIGEKTKKIYKIGDKVTVILDRVNLDYGEIDFSLI